MGLRLEDRIPDDVLVLMETSVDAWLEAQSSEMGSFRHLIGSYRDHLGTPGESDHRKALAEAYLALVSDQHEALLDHSQREALERCARGFPYAPRAS